VSPDSRRRPGRQTRDLDWALCASRLPLALVADGGPEDAASFAADAERYRVGYRTIRSAVPVTVTTAVTWAATPGAGCRHPGAGWIAVPAPRRDRAALDTRHRTGRCRS